MEVLALVFISLIAGVFLVAFMLDEAARKLRPWEHDGHEEHKEDDDEHY